MKKISDLLSGTRTLEEITSKYNGEIQVVKDFTWGTYIKAGGLTQSGGVINNIWKETLKKVIEKKPQIDNCLILGLGGGTAAKFVSQYWVGSKITGIDIDKQMVDLGKKYLGLDQIKINIQITDAMNFVKKEKKQYDLILVDLYSGDKYPEKFETDQFIKNIKKLCIYDGIVVFNRLYGGDKRPASMKMSRRLEKYFKIVDHIFPQANVELICYN